MAAGRGLMQATIRARSIRAAVVLLAAGCEQVPVDDEHEVRPSDGAVTVADAAASDATHDATHTFSACEVMFGQPNAMTGLSAEQCQPRCGCAQPTAFAPEPYGTVEFARARGWVLMSPCAPIENDPYLQIPPTEQGVCAVMTDTAEHTYTLHSYATAGEAEAAGAHVTHDGACGVCSTLQDLAVYMEQNDLTAPVRACGLQHFSGSKEEHVACLLALGFSRPCADIWYYNTKHTALRCGTECFAALGQPYHLSDGSLNACLSCDERESGPVFKGVAGRTRRNTGVPNALCRPCNEVVAIDHRSYL